MANARFSNILGVSLTGFPVVVKSCL